MLEDGIIAYKKKLRCETSEPVRKKRTYMYNPIYNLISERKKQTKTTIEIHIYDDIVLLPDFRNNEKMTIWDTVKQASPHVE